MGVPSYSPVGSLTKSWNRTQASCAHQHHCHLSGLSHHPPSPGPHAAPLPTQHTTPAGPQGLCTCSSPDVCRPHCLAFSAGPALTPTPEIAVPNMPHPPAMLPYNLPLSHTQNLPAYFPFCFLHENKIPTRWEHLSGCVAAACSPEPSLGLGHSRSSGNRYGGSDVLGFRELSSLGKPPMLQAPARPSQCPSLS